MTVYSEVKAAGGYISNHESDLYIEVNEQNREILSRYPLQRSNAKTFRNQVTNKPCWDVPFAYDPWWDARAVQTRIEQSPTFQRKRSRELKRIKTFGYGV